MHGRLFGLVHHVRFGWAVRAHKHKHAHLAISKPWLQMNFSHFTCYRNWCFWTKEIWISGFLLKKKKWNKIKTVTHYERCFYEMYATYFVFCDRFFIIFIAYNVLNTAKIPSISACNFSVMRFHLVSCVCIFLVAYCHWNGCYARALFIYFFCFLPSRFFWFPPHLTSTCIYLFA